MSDDQNSEQAREALKAIESTQDKSRAMAFYRANGFTVMVWGAVWLVCNTTSFLRPEIGNEAWFAGIVIGMIASVYGGWKHGQQTPSLTGRKPPPLRHILMGVVIALVLFAALTAIASIGNLQDSRQMNAIISLFVAVGYITSGLYAGWRMCALGLIVGAAAIIGWFFLREWFELIMGLIGGGSLILGGFWMWRS